MTPSRWAANGSIIPSNGLSHKSSPQPRVDSRKYCTTTKRPPPCGRGPCRSVRPHLAEQPLEILDGRVLRRHAHRRHENRVEASQTARSVLRTRAGVDKISPSLGYPQNAPLSITTCAGSRDDVGSGSGFSVSVRVNGRPTRRIHPPSGKCRRKTVRLSCKLRRPRRCAPRPRRTGPERRDPRHSSRPVRTR